MNKIKALTDLGIDTLRTPDDILREELEPRIRWIPSDPDLDHLSHPTFYAECEDRGTHNVHWCDTELYVDPEVDRVIQVEVENHKLRGLALKREVGIRIWLKHVEVVRHVTHKSKGSLIYWEYTAQFGWEGA